MKKSILTIVLSFSMLVASPSVSYAGGAANGAGLAMIQSYVGAAAAGAAAADQFTACAAPFAWFHCVTGGLLAIQAVFMVIGAGKAGDAAGLMCTGTSASTGRCPVDPTESGLCFDATCDPDVIDSALVDAGFDDAFATGEGYEEAEAALLSKANAQLASLEKKGYKVNLKAGTITAPNGKTFGGANFKGKMSSKLAKLTAEKMARIQKAFGAKQGVASAGGKKGGVIYQDEYVGGFGSGNYGKKEKKKNKKGRFLAGLSDKDAGRGGVGFAGDDIFGMIKRRYTKKMKAKEFLTK